MGGPLAGGESRLGAVEPPYLDLHADDGPSLPASLTSDDGGVAADFSLVSGRDASRSALEVDVHDQGNTSQMVGIDYTVDFSEGSELTFYTRRTDGDYSYVAVLVDGTVEFQSNPGTEWSQHSIDVSGYSGYLPLTLGAGDSDSGTIDAIYEIADVILQ